MLASKVSGVGTTSQETRRTVLWIVNQLSHSNDAVSSEVNRQKGYMVN